MKIKVSEKSRSAALIFGIGVLTGAIALLFGVSGGGQRSLPDLLDAMAPQAGLYAATLVVAGLVWVVIAAGIARLAPPAGPLGWAVRIIAATVLMGPLTRAATIITLAAMSELSPFMLARLAELRFWFGYLYEFPYNIVAFLRGGILVALAVGPRDWGLGSVARGQFAPGPLSAGGPDQVTRVLCGNALLGGAAFRRAILNFFKNRWTATAPEFGLDVGLLVHVCGYAEAHEEVYRLGFAAIGVVGTLLMLAMPATGLSLFLLAAAALWFFKCRGAQRLARMFSQASFSRAVAARRFDQPLDPTIVDALPRDDQNLVVYGGFVPFVGAGHDWGGWSLVTFVDKPKVKGAGDRVRPFTIADLDGAIDTAMAAMRLPGLRRREYYFVRGLDIKGDPDILADLAHRPRQVIAAELGAMYGDDRSTRLRAYKCFQVIDWGGEIIVSYFLRCSLHGNSLLVEMKRYMLTPLADWLRRVDRLGSDGPALRIGQALISLVAGPFMALAAPFMVLAMAKNAIVEALTSEERKARRRRRAAQNDPGTDFGAFTSLRAWYAQNNYVHYFQKSDADFGSKMIDAKILDEIERFLDDHGIDTTDIRNRQSTILNSGILVQGGDVRAESLAVGQGAQANKVESQRPAQSPA